MKRLLPLNASRRKSIAGEGYPGRPAVSLREAFPQVTCVRGRVALPVVVQVDEDLAAGAPCGDPPAPPVELGLRVVAATTGVAVVEAQVGELPDRLRLRKRPALVVP